MTLVLRTLSPEGEIWVCHQSELIGQTRFDTNRSMSAL